MVSGENIVEIPEDLYSWQQQVKLETSILVELVSEFYSGLVNNEIPVELANSLTMFWFTRRLGNE